MDPVLHLMHVRGVVRQAIKLVKGVNIKTSSDRLTLEVFSVVGWFKVARGGEAHWRGSAEGFTGRGLPWCALADVIAQECGKDWDHALPSSAPMSAIFLKCLA